MTPISTSRHPDHWEAIAHDYAARALTVDEICARHAISISALYYHRRIKGWACRRPRLESPANRRARMKDFGRRLTDALDSKLAAFERHLAAAAQGGAPSSSADAERDARTLNTLVHLLEKLSALCEKAAAPAPRAAPRTQRDAHDADRRRSEIARRLEGLKREPKTQPRPKPQPNPRPQPE